MKKIFFLIMLFLSLESISQNLNGFDEDASRIIRKNPYATKWSEDVHEAAFGNDIITFCYKTNVMSEGKSGEEFNFLRGIIQIGNNSYEVIGQEWMSERFYGVLYSAKTKKVKGVISCYNDLGTAYYLDLIWPNQAVINYELQEVKVGRESFDFDKRVIEIANNQIDEERKEEIKTYSSKLEGSNEVNALVINFPEFIRLFKLNDAQLNNTLFSLGWEYVTARESVNKNSSTECLVYKNNGRNTIDKQVLNRYVSANLTTGRQFKVLELIVSDFEYIEKLLKLTGKLGFKLVSKSDGEYKFASPEHLLLIEKTVVKDIVLYKIKLS